MGVGHAGSVTGAGRAAGTLVRVTEPSRRTRVAVVFGGRSSEHAISCISAGSVMRALDPERYEVVPIGITPDGRWVLEAAEPERLAIVDGVFPAVDGTASAVVLPADPTQAGLQVLEPGTVPRALGAVDVVFPVLHGPYGEDGTLQGLLEMAGVPYVGSGVYASSAAMDKVHMKAAFRAAGLAVGPYEVVTDRQWRDERADVMARLGVLGLPVFVKPARAGSSVGITKVSDRAGLEAAVEAARKHDPKVVVEASIEGGREVECGVLVDAEGRPQPSVCAEIRVFGDHDFYDFEAKYLDSAELVVPADLDEGTARTVRAMAVEAFEALDCEGLARVDFFVTAAGGVVLNEVNTMPGFTSISMFPRMWAECGVSYPELVDRLVQDAVRRGTGLR
jgi:D-alanine-D-alanine ligase